MTLLAWQRAGRGDAVVLVHGWAGDATSCFADTGWVGALTAAGFAPYLVDLPGHGESADVPLPADRPVVPWSAEVIAADLQKLGVTAIHAVGFDEGCYVAGNLAVAFEGLVTRLVLIGCDDRAGVPGGPAVAQALKDPGAPVWQPDAAESLAKARRAARSGHDLTALARWAEAAAWPAAARLGALRTPVLLAIGSDDERGERAPRLAQLFHDARLVRVPGGHHQVLAEPLLHEIVARFLAEAQADTPASRS